MTDLVKRVALRLGWTDIEMSTDHDGCPIIQGRLDGVQVESQPWDQSVDAALGVLDKTHLKIQYTVKYGIWVVVYKKICRGSNKSLPRAILEAFLEAGE